VVLVRETEKPEIKVETRPGYGTPLAAYPIGQAILDKNLFECFVKNRCRTYSVSPTHGNCGSPCL